MVVDDFTCEHLVLVVDKSLSGMRVAHDLNAIAQARGRPLMIVSDYCTKLTSRTIRQWQEDNRVEWHYISPGKPTQNGFVESLNGRFGTNASTSTCSAAWQGADQGHVASSKNAGSTTISIGRTLACAASPRTSFQPGPDRTTGRTESSYERRLIRGNVTDCPQQNAISNFVEFGPLLVT